MSELWVPGAVLPSRRRVMTAERMRWYADALETCSVNEVGPVIAPANIHTDDDLARANGLVGRVADGMISTNWISSMLEETFGPGAFAGGSLRTRYVRPIYQDERIEIVIRVTRHQEDDQGRQTVSAEVSCLKDDGQVATGGEATVVLAER